MNVMGLVAFLVIGLVAGWIAGNLMKGRGFGLAGNMVVGVIGAVLGGFLFGSLRLGGGGPIWALFTAVVGSVILLFAISFIKKA